MQALRYWQEWQAIQSDIDLKLIQIELLYIKN